MQRLTNRHNRGASGHLARGHLSRNYASPDTATGVSETGDHISVSSRRGTISLAVRPDDSIERGSDFIPFHFREAAANILSTDALDPYGKIPEFKYCAVKIENCSKSITDISLRP